MEKLEEFLEWGGTKKDITCLVLSGIALAASIAKIPICRDVWRSNTESI